MQQVWAMWHRLTNVQRDTYTCIRLTHVGFHYVHVSHICVSHMTCMCLRHSSWHTFVSHIHTWVSHIHTCVSHIHTCVSHLHMWVSHIHTCVSHIHVCVSHIHTCVSHIRTCVSHIRTCVSHIHTCVSHIHTCVSHIHTCVSHTHPTCPGNIAPPKPCATSMCPTYTPVCVSHVWGLDTNLRRKCAT